MLLLLLYADNGLMLVSCFLVHRCLWHSIHTLSSQNTALSSLHDNFSVTMVVSVLQNWSQASNHMCFTPQQSQQYVLALKRFFVVAELEILRFWVDAATVSGPSTLSHF